MVEPKSSDFVLEEETPEMRMVGSHLAALSAMEMLGMGPPLVLLAKSSHSRLDQELQRTPLRALAVAADEMKPHKSYAPVTDPVPHNEHFEAY